jgi:hypothetical protein
MSLFDEHYVRCERMALDHDAERAAAIGVHVASTQRARRRRWRAPIDRALNWLHPGRATPPTTPPIERSPDLGMRFGPTLVPRSRRVEDGHATPTGRNTTIVRGRRDKVSVEATDPASAVTNESEKQVQ